jgi:PEP-CTERM motif
MKKILNSLLVSAAVLLPAAQADAAVVTWDIVTTFQDLKGTVTFDNAPIAGLQDGAYDGNDTHIFNAVLTLTSASLGINYINNSAYFQPLTNTFDNKHIDTCYPCGVSSNAGNISLTFSPNSDQGSPAVGASSYYLYVNGAGFQNAAYRWAFSDTGGQNNTNLSNVPEPSALALAALTLVGVAVAGRKRVAA